MPVQGLGGHSTSRMTQLPNPKVAVVLNSQQNHAAHRVVGQTQLHWQHQCLGLGESANQHGVTVVEAKHLQQLARHDSSTMRTTHSDAHLTQSTTQPTGNAKG